MRFLIVMFLLVTYIHADLDSKIISNAKTACYLKNPTNGLSASDYSPTVAGQILLQEYTNGSDCNSWLTDPYVNIDTETYKVIADMSCVVSTDESDVSTATIYQYYLDIDCQASCEVPRDSNGNIYDFTPYINEPDCSVSNLQQLVLAEDPNSLYIIDDAQYLNCTSNNNLTGCFYKKTLNFDGNIDSNITDNNTTLNDTNLTGTNERLDSIGEKIESNGQKFDVLGTKLDNLGAKIESNGQKIDNVGYKIDALGTQITTLGTKIDANGIKIDNVRNAVTDTGNYLGSKLDTNSDKIKNEIKFQGDRLHADLEALNAKPNTPDINVSNNFDDSGIIEAIHQNTDAINEIKDLNEDEFETDASVLDTYQTYYDDMIQSIQDVENNVNDLMATIQGDYTPQFQSHSSCTIQFMTYNKSKSINMCRYASILRPFFTFILTIAMLVLLIRLHFYLFPKVYKSD